VVEPVPLFSYQRTGVEFLASKYRAGLFDVMRIGKTAQAIRALDKLGAMRGIVVCPASARSIWVAQFKKFGLKVRVVAKGLKLKHLKAFLRYAIDVILLSWEMATTWRRQLETQLYDFVILDESQYAKNPHSQRTRAALGHNCSGEFGYARMGAYTWFLTGTPMTRDPADIWTWLRFCGGTLLTLSQFTARYFVAKPGSFNNSFTPRKEALPELRGLIQKFSLRRTLKDVYPDLPPIWVNSESIDGDTSEITALLKEHPGLAAEVLQAVEKGGLSFLEAQHVMTLRRLVGEAKAPVYAAQLIEELAADPEGKRVAFFAHTRALTITAEALAAAGIAYVTVDGSVSERARVEAQRRFQEDPACRVFLGNITAAGTAIELSAAHRLDMVESAWTPGPNAQAIMRIVNPAKATAEKTKESYLVRFFGLANSIDDRVSESIARKTAAIAMVEGKTDG